MTPLIFHILRRRNNRDINQITSSQWRWVGKKTDCKGALSDGNILCYDLGRGYTTIYIYQNSSNCTLKKNKFNHM